MAETHSAWQDLWDEFSEVMSPQMVVPLFSSFLVGYTVLLAVRPDYIIGLSWFHAVLQSTLAGLVPFVLFSMFIEACLTPIYWFSNNFSIIPDAEKDKQDAVLDSSTGLILVGCAAVHLYLALSVI